MKDLLPVLEKVKNEDLALSYIDEFFGLLTHEYSQKIKGIHNAFNFRGEPMPVAELSKY